MKANELRLGNLINYKTGGICQVAFIALSIADYGICGFVKPECFEPIPLTEEWLVKFGFEWSCEYHERNPMEIDIDLHNSFTIYPPFEYKKYWYVSVTMPSGGTWEIDVKYIHQLQNLYFALTGEELTIKE